MNLPSSRLTAIEYVFAKGRNSSRCPRENVALNTPPSSLIEFPTFTVMTDRSYRTLISKDALAWMKKSKTITGTFLGHYAPLGRRMSLWLAFRIY